MTERVSVTEVRNALRCPRIFALGRLEEKAVAFPVGSSCLGASFHRLVERFAQSVDSPPSPFSELPDNAPVDALETALVRWILALLSDDLKSDPGYHSIPGEVDELAEALREFSRHLAGRIDAIGNSPQAALVQVVHSGERPIEAAWPHGPLVHGRLDAIFADGSGELEVIEYKLTDEANSLLDQAQSVLYQQLLLLSEDKVARASVLRFTPTLRENNVSEGVAHGISEKYLAPLLAQMPAWAKEPLTAPPTERKDLCATCPMAQACSQHYPMRFPHRDDPPVAGTRPRNTRNGSGLEPSPAPLAHQADTDAEGRADAARIQALIIKELSRLGASVQCPVEPTVGPRSYLIEVSRQRGSVAQLDRAATDVQHRLASEHNIELEYQKESGRRRFWVTRAKPKVVYLGPLLKLKEDWLSAQPGRFIVGQEPNGKCVTGDFSDGSTPHLLVAGQTGSGKSVFLQSLLASLVRYFGPEHIRFNLVDPKRVTFTSAAFRSSMSSHLQAPISFDTEETLPLIGQLVDLMNERYALFEKEQVTDIQEFNEACPTTPLERRILVIDEFQDLLTNKETAQDFCAGIQRLGSKARAAGIHMVLATQRPDRQAIPPSIKSNLTGRIAFQVASGVNSRIILDQPGAEKLLGKGDMYASLGRGRVRAQAALMSEG